MTETKTDWQKSRERKQICIMCKKRNPEGCLFCDNCREEDIFLRINIFKKVVFLRTGWYTKGTHHGRLPTLQEREREP